MTAIRTLIATALVLTQPVFRVDAATPGIDPWGAPHGPAPTDPGPTDPGPSAEQEPAHAPGEAEPAPPPTNRPFDAADRRAPRRRVALMPRFAYRLGEAGRAVTPAPGYGLAGTIEIAYLRSPVGIEGLLGIDFSYDRFAAGEVGVVNDGMVRMFGYTRVISETSFILVHTAAVAVGPVRPYFTIGGGLGLGYFDSAAMELRPGSARDAHFLGRASLGMDVTLGRTWSVAIRGDYTAVRGISPFVTSDGRPLALFGDLFGLGAGVAYRF